MKKQATVMMRSTALCMMFLSCTLMLTARELPELRVSEDGHYLVTAKGDPFFWLGGTAWEMLHRLNEEETLLYLTDRAGKGFTVIQTVILAELDGLTTPNSNGDLPLIDQDPAQINEPWFRHVDRVIGMASDLGLYIGLLPTWGDKFNAKWGEGPEIFTPENSEIYGEILGRRYRDQSNIIWILGGDRFPENELHVEIINAMARGIKKAGSKHLITYHPQGGGETAAEYFNEAWLDVDMFQSGHDMGVNTGVLVRKGRDLMPPRPVINGEPLYENIPNRFWTTEPVVWLDDVDVRRTAYRTMLSGAAGYTYGCNDIWQMYSIGREPKISARTGWQEAIHLPGSKHMKHMKDLLERFPWQQMTSDPTLLLNDNPEGAEQMVCAVGADRDFLMVYTPVGKPVRVDFSRLNALRVKAFWYNPRSGKSLEAGVFDVSETPDFTPWATGPGSDFVLVVMDAVSTYILPE